MYIGGFILGVLDVHKDTPLEPATVQNNSSSLVLVNGCYVNVEQLLLRLEQSEDLKAEIDNQFKLSQSQLRKTCYLVEDLV